MRLRYHTIFFDFDGTLCATGRGIEHCVAYALEQMGFPVPDEAGLRRYIGPPAEYAYIHFAGMTLAQAQQAVRIFRSLYNVEGWKESELYAGVPALLRDLRAAGAKLLTASSKPEEMVRRLLKRDGIYDAFDFICAAQGDGPGAQKAHILRRAMAACGLKDPAAGVLVGDTRFDLEGARAVGMPFLGAGYGYAGSAALRAAGAEEVADTGEGLRGHLFLWDAE